MSLEANDDDSQKWIICKIKKKKIANDSQMKCNSFIVYI